MLTTARQTDILRHIMRRRRTDPTGTTTLRLRYGRAMTTRFGIIRRHIRDAILEQAVFSPTARRQALTLLQAPPPGAWALLPPDEAIAAFLGWLREELDENVLEVIDRDGEAITRHTHWQDVYVRAAYTKGVTDARQHMAQAGAALLDVRVASLLTAPMHSDRLQLLFARNFADLRGITQAMSTAIGRELAQGMVEGVGPRVIARRLVKEVDGIGKRRGMLLARSEIVRAHQHGALNEYERLGVQGVTVQVEILVTQDGRQCPRCQVYHGRVLPIAEARAIFPRHPQ